MDARLVDELQRILGTKMVTPPCVFIGGWYIGGAEKMIRMSETGELKKLIQQIGSCDSIACDGCGGQRYVVCEKCNGSHKMYVEKYGVFKTCLFCSPNGLIRCPLCSSFLLGN